jgi:hypothetical protein
MIFVPKNFDFLNKPIYNVYIIKMIYFWHSNILLHAIIAFAKNCVSGCGACCKNQGVKSVVGFSECLCQMVSLVDSPHHKVENTTQKSTETRGSLERKYDPG